jgi:hypothetical protein
MFRNARAGMPWRTVAVCTLTATAVVSVISARPEVHEARSAPVRAAALNAACAQWDDAASQAIAALLRDASDVDLRRASDAIFLLRRARRHCDAGWIRLACLDYRGIVRRHAPALEAQIECAIGRADQPATRAVN